MKHILFFAAGLASFGVHAQGTAGWVCQAQCNAYVSGAKVYEGMGSVMGFSAESRIAAFADMAADCAQLMADRGYMSWDMYIVSAMSASYDAGTSEDSDTTSWGSSVSASSGVRGWFYSRGSSASASSGGSRTVSHYESWERTSLNAAFALANQEDICHAGTADLEARRVLRRARYRYRGSEPALGG
jgi:hypothetical protein